MKRARPSLPSTVMPVMLKPPRLRLNVQNATRATDLPSAAVLRKWCKAALERSMTLTLRFVDTREGRALNRDFRQKDYATNVLTFNYEDGSVNTEADIIVCVPVLRKEAAEQGKTLRAHLAHLVVHGTLHAQGYDHETLREARRMEPREIAALSLLRIANPYE